MRTVAQLAEDICLYFGEGDPVTHAKIARDIGQALTGGLGTTTTAWRAVPEEIRDALLRSMEAAVLRRMVGEVSEASAALVEAMDAALAVLREAQR